MIHHPRPSLATRLYVRLLGIDRRRVAGTAPNATGPRLRDVAYYAYQKGFWPYVRGLLLRPRLAGCGGRFFLGRRVRTLFPGRLRVGRNVAIGDYTFMSCYGQRGVVLGDNVRIREHGWVQVTSQLTNPGVGLTIGADTYVGPRCVLGAGGGIEIGRNVVMGAYVQLLAEDHGFADPARPINEQGVGRQGIRIGDDCWFGNSVIVLDGVSIGVGSVVGAGSVVTRDVPPRTIVAGNPARVIRERGTS